MIWLSGGVIFLSDKFLITNRMWSSFLGLISVGLRDCWPVIRKREISEKEGPGLNCTRMRVCQSSAFSIHRGMDVKKMTGRGYYRKSLRKPSHMYNLMQCALLHLSRCGKRLETGSEDRSSVVCGCG